MDASKKSRRSGSRSEDGLTSLEREFLAGYIARGGSSSADAGWRAYQACNPTTNENTARGEALRLLRRPHVRVYLAHIERVVAERASCTLEQHVSKLAELRDAALQQGDVKTAISAEELRGKACGLYVERVEHTDQTESRWTGDWSSRIDFARRVAFILRLGERAVAEGQTVEHQALPAPDETTH